MSPFKSNEIDSLLDNIRRTSERVRIYADEITDGIIVDTHKIAHDNKRTTQDIHGFTKETREGVVDLRWQINEIREQQKSFQATLDAIAGKNDLLNFLVEYVSTLNAVIPPWEQPILTDTRRTLAKCRKQVAKFISTCI
jgi:hypothetical protein